MNYLHIDNKTREKKQGKVKVKHPVKNGATEKGGKETKRRFHAEERESKRRRKGHS